jgi:hypothetical protein
VKQFLRRITGLSTPFGGISWEPSDKEPPIQSLVDTVCITLAENDTFIRFLEGNTEKVVFLNVHLDASVAMEEQWKRVEEEQIDLDEFTAGRLSGATLPLPNQSHGMVGLTFHLLRDRVLSLSTGGTGTLMCQVTGFFEVSTTFHGGPSRTFHMREVEASIDLHAKFLLSAQRRPTD